MTMTWEEYKKEYPRRKKWHYNRYLKDLKKDEVVEVGAIDDVQKAIGIHAEPPPADRPASDSEKELMGLKMERDGLKNQMRQAIGLLKEGRDGGDTLLDDAALKYVKLCDAALDVAEKYREVGGSAMIYQEKEAEKRNKRIAVLEKKAKEI